jgi:hypothetical protein
MNVSPNPPIAPARAALTVTVRVSDNRTYRDKSA